MRFSLKRRLGNAFPKLNAQGSNPFARFESKAVGTTRLRPETGCGTARQWEGSLNSCTFRPSVRFTQHPAIFATGSVHIAGYCH